MHNSTVFFLILLHSAFAGMTYRSDGMPPGLSKREVGGSISRTSWSDGHQRTQREVGGAITRNYPGVSAKRDVSEEVWTVVQTEEENLTMDNVRGKDTPLSLTADFRGIEPVPAVQYDGLDYPLPDFML